MDFLSPPRGGDIVSDESKLRTEFNSEAPTDLAKSPKKGTNFTKKGHFCGQDLPSVSAHLGSVFVPKNAGGEGFGTHPEAMGKGNFGEPMDGTCAKFLVPGRAPPSGGHMSQNGAGRGTLDGPASLMSGNGSKKASEAEFGMENSPNQPMAQGGVQAHLPKPPGTPKMDGNMWMATGPPQVGEHISEIRPKNAWSSILDAKSPKAISEEISVGKMRFSAEMASEKAFSPHSMAPEILSDTNSDTSGQSLGLTSQGGGYGIHGKCCSDFCDPSDPFRK
jgi:hypothetical protein